MLILIGTVLAVVIVFHLFVFHQYNLPWTVNIINKIPGPEGIFYFGSSLHFWNTKHEDRIADICNHFEVYGSTYRVWFSGVPTIFISELEDYQTILGSRMDSSKGIMYRHILPWLGRGLLTSSGHKWHTRRKIITPTFHFTILQGFVETFNKNAQNLLKRLEQAREQATDTQVDLTSLVSLCTLDNICETAMGSQVNALSDEPSSYVSAVFRMGTIISERIFSPLLFPDANFALSQVGREHNQLLQKLHNFTKKVISECQKSSNYRSDKRLDLHYQPDKNVTGIYRNKMTFLKMLLEKKSLYRLSDKDIREEVDTFMFEGHDTTSMGITWTLFELGFHESVQEKCYEEQRTIFGDSERLPKYQDVAQMYYLKQVIQEALRLHPSVPIISRKFPVDMQLKDFVVPTNTEIIMCLYHLHRNPKMFPNPNQFDPDRFLPENIKMRHSFAYLPFSAGLRNCVGQRFALLELLIVLSTIIRHYKIKTVGNRADVKAVPDMTLRPATRVTWEINRRTPTT